MAIMNPPYGRTNFFHPEPVSKADAERRQLTVGLGLANRFTYMSGQMELADKALQLHFLPLVTATLAEQGETAAREILLRIPQESLAYVQALNLICDWQQRVPS